MKLHPIDTFIIIGYLMLVALMGFWIKKRATKHLDSYFLADNK